MTLPDGPFVRVGDAEREQATAVLRRAASEGRLTPAELDDRVDRALASRTRGELHALLADLVPRAPLEEMLTGVPLARNLGAGYSWEDPLVITAGWNGEKLAGRWEVPPFLEANPVASDVKLDFQDAVPVSLIIDLVHLGGAGNLVVVVPEGWGANLRAHRKGLGSVKSSVNEVADRGRPQLMIRGAGALGSLVVRYPNAVDRWRRDRALARGRRGAAR